LILKELLEGIYPRAIESHYEDWDIRSISCDSRVIQGHSLFVAIQGSQFKGSEFIQEAIDKGVRVIIDKEESQLYKSGEESQLYKSGDDLCYLTVEDPRAFLKKIVKRFYHSPSEHISTIGITGTNGKTTITYIVESILLEAGISCGVMGTVFYKIGDQIVPSKNTTPGLLENQQYLAQMVNEGLDCCVMEVSSHALDQGRVDLIDFKTAVFTNLTSDHLDYHKTREQYFAAKSKLFERLSEDSTAIINADDVFGRKLKSMTSAKILTYGIESKADVMAKDIQSHLTGIQFKLICEEGQAVIRTNLVGLFNVYNILASVAIGLSNNVSLEVIKKGVENVKCIPGRVEPIDYGQDYTILIDYAHTQDALENVLQMIRNSCDSRIILVFGCGGDRDKSKRPEMGQVACDLADFVFITSDNPRSEDPSAIISDIVKGVRSGNYETVVNRENAIRQAMQMAQTGDVVLIAGKGHETCQIFEDKTISFDERQIIRQFL